MNQYSIGQVAKITGLPAKTIRFYEEEGVVKLPRRGENSYRIYSLETIEELKVISAARNLGLPLTEIRKLMKGCESGQCEHTKTEIETSLNNYLELLTNKISQQQRLKTKLEELSTGLSSRHCDESGYCCDLLHQLIGPLNNEEGGETHDQEI